MSVKVYLTFDEGSSSSMPKKVSKIGIPATWQKTKEASDILKLFCTSYNKENPDNQLDAETCHLEDSDDKKIPSNERIEVFLQDRADFKIKPGAFVREVVATVFDSRPRCKNYGCNKHFSEEDNSDTACQHHNGPPIFHDTMKCWSCCRDRKAYDFESFQEIKGCNVGRHSLVPPSVHIAPSPNARPNDDTGASGGGASGGAANVAPPQPVLKSISDYNSQNADAVTATSSALKQLSTRVSTRKPDGTARCLRGGCQIKNFNVVENSTTACTYHAGSAIFHDGGKYWSCCPGTKRFEFEEFLKIPGCCTGFHDDGEIEL